MMKLEEKTPLPKYQSSRLIQGSSSAPPPRSGPEPEIQENGSREASSNGTTKNHHVPNGLNHFQNGNGASEQDSSEQETRDRLNSFPRIDPTSIPRMLRRNTSFSDCILDRNERRVLVIYTGGTIGMVRSIRGGNLFNLFTAFLFIPANLNSLANCRAFPLS